MRWPGTIIGFIAPGYDPFGCRGHGSPTWDKTQLMKHLKAGQPLFKSRLDLAKALIGNGQHEEANRWFRRAEVLGVDPVEFNFNWGANAFFEGDLPTVPGEAAAGSGVGPQLRKIATMLVRAQLANVRRCEGFLRLAV